MNGTLGNVLVVGGLVLIGIGLMVKTGALDWFGRLPGDIRIERESTRIYVPWVSMLLISAVASGLMRLIAWILRDR